LSSRWRSRPRSNPAIFIFTVFDMIACFTLAARQLTGALGHYLLAESAPSMVLSDSAVRMLNGMREGREICLSVGLVCPLLVHVPA
jgi:hypothetical protein